MLLLKKISITIYAGLGGIYLLAGVVAMFNPHISIAERIGSSRLNNEYILLLQQDMAHLTMELASAILTIGCLFIWAEFNYKSSAKLNYLFLLFTMLFGAVHWYEFVIGNRDIASPLINSLPAALILLVLIMTRNVYVKGV